MDEKKAEEWVCLATECNVQSQERVYVVEVSIYCHTEDCAS